MDSSGNADERLLLFRVVPGSVEQVNTFCMLCMHVCVRESLDRGSRPDLNGRSSFYYCHFDHGLGAAECT